MKFNLLQKLSTTAQGYVFAIFTMCIWGSFSLMARLNVYWGISSWDIIALRYGVSALILLPFMIYKKEYHFLFNAKAVVLAIVGGLGYNCLVYSAFLLAPVAHGAVFLNGMIPVATALLSWIFLKKRPDQSTKTALIIIGITLSLMTFLMYQHGMTLGLGDLLFMSCAFCWSIYGLLLAQWQLSAWQVVCSTAIWSAVLYLPIYFLFIGADIDDVKTSHLFIQGGFHGVLVMIVATVTYALAVERLGAFFAGGLASLAPFIASVLAYPLLGEPLNQVLILGLIGMGLGTVQPWRFFRRP